MSCDPLLGFDSILDTIRPGGRGAGGDRKQADGSKFRLGRLPAKEYWDFSGTLLRRNHMATWKWTSNFFVLDNGLLYEFEDNMLTSKIVSVWPILGATFSRVQASAQQQDDGSACTLGWAERHAKETSIAHGLNRQLLAQLTANGFTFTELEKAGEKRGVHCKGSCFPFLQTKASEQLLNATVNAGAWIKLNSALRTSSQQYLLWRWAALGRIKISKASRPGTPTTRTAWP